MGSDILLLVRLLADLIFQSTLPAWGATIKAIGVIGELYISIHAPRMGSDILSTGNSSPERYFNPRSPHGERHFTSSYPAVMLSISIHAPRMGSDTLGAKRYMLDDISIHAPRMGSDYPWGIFVTAYANFNPRSPHGERQYSQSIQQ